MTSTYFERVLVMFGTISRMYISMFKDYPCLIRSSIPHKESTDAD